MPMATKDWLLWGVQAKLIKIGRRLVRFAMGLDRVFDSLQEVRTIVEVMDCAFFGRMFEFHRNPERTAEFD